MLPVEARDPQTYALIGIAMEVHRVLGAGFLEAAYQEAFAIELRLRGIPFQREVCLQITYKDEILACTYKADFVCFEDIVVEMKAIRQLTAVDRAQLINYLKATNQSRGLLFNFGSQSLEYERLSNSLKSA